MCLRGRGALPIRASRGKPSWLMSGKPGSSPTASSKVSFCRCLPCGVSELANALSGLTHALVASNLFGPAQRCGAAHGHRAEPAEGGAMSRRTRTRTRMHCMPSRRTSARLPINLPRGVVGGGWEVLRCHRCCRRALRREPIARLVYSPESGLRSR